MKKSLIFIMCIILFPISQGVGALPLQRQVLTVNGYTVELQVPVNMRLEFVAAIAAPAPRFIGVGPDSEFILGSRGANVYRLKYPYTEVETLATLSGYIHSTSYRQGRLYAAETAAVWSAPYIGSSTLLNQGDFTVDAVLPSLTGGHSSRTIVTGPDNRLYVGLGISGNCSDEYLHNSYPFESRRGGVFVLENSTLTPYSSGLRNPIGLAFHPATNVLYATNAGPDNLGYDAPPEILAALSQDSFHGMPWFQFYNGAFNSGNCAQSPPPRPVADASPPAALFDARSTPEGIVFLQGSSLGGQYINSAVAAIHGSWATAPGMGQESRRPPKLSLVVFDSTAPVRVEDLVTGFQRADGSRFARPCGVAVGADGHLYFTSDSGEITGVFRLVPIVKAGKSISSVYNLLLGGG